jgi:uncharacterized RDD family membrane protein YckC
MPDEPGGPAMSGPPSFPGESAPPPPPVAPPSYPEAPTGGFPPPPSFESPTDGPYATWGTRLGGYLIDFVIFLVVLVVLYIPFRHSHALQVHLMMARHGQRRRNVSLAPFLIVAPLYIAYATFLCGGGRGQTVGMMAVRVRVVRDGTLGAIGYGRAFGRALFEQVLRLITGVFFLLGIVWLLDMLFPLWDQKRQTLHDKVAGTVVIRVPNSG